MIFSARKIFIKGGHEERIQIVNIISSMKVEPRENDSLLIAPAWELSFELCINA